MRGQWLVGMAGVLVGLIACEGKHREFVSGSLPTDVDGMGSMTPGNSGADAGDRTGTGSGIEVVGQDGVLRAGECSQGVNECLSITRVRRCTEFGLWSDPEECENACVGGDCGGECKPAQTRCSSPDAVQTCTPSGEWGDTTECMNGCSGDACLGECSFGDARCASSTQEQTCNELGQWVAPVSCLNACVGSACGGACVPNATRCSSTTTLETCGVDGEWGPGTECSNVCLGSACGGDCSPGAARCDTVTGAPQVCGVDGVWQTQPECPFVCTGDGSCGGECVPGSLRCDLTTGAPQRCDASGVWQAQAACPFVCTGNGACTGECTPGDGRCSASGLPQACSAAGIWTEQPACQFVCTGAGSCSGECSNGDRRCNPVSGIPQLCSGGIWQNQPGCQFVCSEGFCAGECAPNSSRCNPMTGVRQLCSGSGSWQDQAACPFACSAGTCSGECVPNDRRCDSGTGLPQRCSAAGLWQNQNQCQFVCTSNGSCTGECIPGSTRCSPTGSGVPQRCSTTGTWQNQNRCQFVCTGNGSCTGECTPGTARCNPQTGVPQLCGGTGTFQSQPACRPGEECVGGSCTCGSRTSCANGCFDLSTDPNNCGACGHSCQGQSCTGGTCGVSVLASNQPVPNSMALGAQDVFFATGAEQIRRVPKGGGPVQTIFDISSDPLAFLFGIAVDGSQVYFGLNLNQTPTPVMRVGAAGGQPITFVQTSADVEISNVVVNGGFLYWFDRGYRRAPINSTPPLTTGQLLGSGTFGTTSLAPVGNCVYAVFGPDIGSSGRSMERACVDGTTRLLYTGDASSFFTQPVGDSSGVYFGEDTIGVKRLPVNTDTPNVTTLAPVASGNRVINVAIDANFVYYVEGASAFMNCTTNWRINRVSKNGGAVTTLVNPPVNCPSYIAVDDTFVYFATTNGGGTIQRVAK